MCHRAPGSGLPHPLAFQFGNVRRVPDSGEIPCKGLVLIKGARERLAGQTPRSAQPQPPSSYLAASAPADMVRAPASPGCHRESPALHCCTEVSLRTSPRRSSRHCPESRIRQTPKCVTAQPTPAEPPVTTEQRPCCCPGLRERRS